MDAILSTQVREVKNVLCYLGSVYDESGNFVYYFAKPCSGRGSLRLKSLTDSVWLLVGRSYIERFYPELIQFIS